ncbi:MAG: ABC transporter ATP-binding protein [Gemmobacter sp.]
MTLLRLEALTVRRAGCPVVDDATLEVRPGEVVGLIGPNGAGKTTLMRAALGLIAHEGRSSLAALDPGARARAAAFIPQGRAVAWPVSVTALVALGRLAQGGADAGGAVDRAIARMGLGPHRDRPATELSGGELARALIARALAQEAPLLMADEPAAGLDPAHQIRTMGVFRELAAEGRGVVVSIHDLGLAARHCTRLVMMHRGRIVADGPAPAVLTGAALAAVFGIRAVMLDSAEGPVIQPVAVLE